MSQKGLAVLLALAGVLLCVVYLYLANNYCPVESSAPPSLNWRLVLDHNRNEKHDRAAYRYGHQKEERHAGSPIFLPSYSLVQKVEAEKDANHGNGESRVWLTKFACDAKLSDLLLALFTYGLFLATGWLVWATLKLWRAGENQFTLLSEAYAEQGSQMRASVEAAQKAADAAKLSADAAVEAERARLFLSVARDDFIQHIKSASGEWPDEKIVTTRGAWKFYDHDLMTYRFKNFGKTPAIIRGIGHGAIISEYLPTAREYSRLIPLPLTTMLGAGEVSDTISFDNFPKITVGDAKSIEGTHATFWFFAYVTYDDMFGWRRTHEFVWHYSAVSHGFSLFRNHETETRLDS